MRHNFVVKNNVLACVHCTNVFTGTFDSLLDRDDCIRPGTIELHNTHMLIANTAGHLMSVLPSVREGTVDVLISGYEEETHVDANRFLELLICHLENYVACGVVAPKRKEDTR